MDQSKYTKKRMKRRKMLRNKRAVSPLIATVLLIAFAVALGAVVMNWGRSYVEDTADLARERSDTEVKCTSEVDMDIIDIDSVPQVCYNLTGGGASAPQVQFIVESKKSKNIEKIQARLIGTGSKVPIIRDLGAPSNLTANQAKFLNVSYNTSGFGIPSQLKLTPYIKVGAETVGCSSNAEVAKSIKACTEIW